MGEEQASNYTTEETAYSAVLQFILEKFEQDSNLALYSDTLFAKWLKFLLKIPDLKSQKLKRRLETHFTIILEKVKTTNLKSLFKLLITEFLIKRVGVRQELQRFTVDYLQGILVSGQADFFKSVALFQLMFEDGSWSLPTSKGTIRLQICHGGHDSEKSLFQQLSEQDQNSIKQAILRRFQQLP